MKNDFTEKLFPRRPDSLVHSGPAERPLHACQLDPSAVDTVKIW